MRKYLPFALSLGTVLFLISRYFIVDFSGPLFGPGDVETNEHMAYLFSQLLRWNPLPSLAFNTDLVAYPYGIDAFPQVWCFEKEYFFTLLSALFGFGPWIQIYIVLSFLITGVGATYLLSRAFSWNIAWVAGVATAGLNFYCLHKYAGHINFVIAHWTVLGVVCDFVLLRNITQGKPATLRLLLVRALLLVLALGQDLGTVAGFSLASFTLSSLYALWLGRKGVTLVSFRELKHEAKEHRFTVVALALSLVSVTFLILPLTIQLLGHFAGAKFTVSTYWANPIRLLLPWFPFFHPGNIPGFDQWIADKPESLGALSPGWALLLGGILGIFSIRKKRLGYYLPLLTLLVLILLFQPKIFPTLKIFPWFKHLRASGRASVVLSTTFILLALAVDWPLWFKRAKGLLPAALSLLLAGEISTAYFIAQRFPGVKASADYYRYLETVKAAKGSAVLDWPFCLWGGNVEVTGLCLDSTRSEPIYAQSRLHGKKVMGLFFGRLNEEMVSPFSNAGWEYFFRRLLEREKSAPCFLDAERDFFLAFYRANDFAGLNVYPDMLPESCEKEFENLFGAPKVSVLSPNQERISFYERPQTWPAPHSAAGKVLSYRPLLKTPTVSFFDPISLGNVDFRNIGEIVEGVRRIDSERALVRFYLEKDVPLTMKIEIRSFMLNQGFRIYHNGVPVTERQPLDDSWRALETSIAGKAGRNKIEVVFENTGQWQDIVRLFVHERGYLAALNLPALQRYYNEYRRRAAEVRQFQWKVGSPSLPGQLSLVTPDIENTGTFGTMPAYGDDAYQRE